MPEESSNPNGAVRTIAIGLLVGIIGTLLTYNRLPALGFAIFVVIELAALYLNARSQDARTLTRNLPLVVAMIFFSAMLVVRSGENIVLLNLAAIGFTALLLAFFFTNGNFAAQDVLQHAMNTVSAGIMSLFKPIDELALTWNWFRARRIEWAIVKPIVRGLVITIPVVGVFIILLSSADKVFADFVGNAFKIFSFQNAADFVPPTLLAFVLAWAGIGWMGFALMDRKAKRMPKPGSLADPVVPHWVLDENPAAQKQPVVFRLGFTETAMLLGSIVMVFGAFVVIQFVYLFGGAKNIEVSRYNYADYVHRGFTELIIVGVLTLGLAYLLKAVSVRSSQGRETAFRVLSTVLIALTGVILASAFLRMHLYEEVYGATTLRLIIYVFIGWLGALFAGFALSLYWAPRTINVFGLAALLAVFGFVSTIDALNPDAFVVGEMLARNDVDPLYLSTLHTEAVPAMVQLVDAPEPGLREMVRYILARERDTLTTATNADMRDFSLGRSAALAALDSVKDKLPASVPSSMPSDTHVKADFDFLKPGMTFRQILRQLGNPSAYALGNIIDRYGYSAAYYDDSNLEVRYDLVAGQGCMLLEIDTQNGFKSKALGCGGA